MFSLVVWTLIGGAFVLFLLVLNGHFDPKTILIWPAIIGIGVLFGDIIAAFALFFFILMVVVLVLMIVSSLDANKHHLEQIESNPYYNPVTRQTEYCTERELKLTPGVAKAILKIDYSDITAKYRLSKNDIDNILRVYILDKELIPPKYDGYMDYLKRQEALYPYDNIVRFLDLHCLKKDVKFRKWGCLDNEIVFPLSEHVRKYKTELDRMGIKVNTDHSGYQKRTRLPQRYQFRENAEAAQKKSKR